MIHDTAVLHSTGIKARTAFRQCLNDVLEFLKRGQCRIINVRGHQTMLMLMYVLYCTRDLHRESGSPRLSWLVGFGKWRGQSWWLDLGILRLADGSTESEGMKRASITIIYVDGREDRERGNGHGEVVACTDLYTMCCCSRGHG